jgi:hypothetical protein
MEDILRSVVGARNGSVKIGWGPDDPILDRLQAFAAAIRWTEVRTCFAAWLAVRLSQLLQGGALPSRRVRL